ncbi:MAG TPA: hypothetical protein VM513_22025 [Kofleriaceae bacterium]|jgi:hypothetical protein|nr:hypothetical protein [Kofleriaceae bacterium]
MSLDNLHADLTESDGLDDVATAVYWPPAMRPPATTELEPTSDGVPSAAPTALTAKTMMVRCVGKPRARTSF